MPVFRSNARRVSVPDPKRERLAGALGRIAGRWGPQAIIPASAALSPFQGISTGFVALDQILGPRGVPLQAITLLSGSSTCGKLTLAYKILSQAQHAEASSGHSVAILDLGASTDADYLVRCGIDLDSMLFVRPSSSNGALRVLLDLVQSRELRVILVDSLPDLVMSTERGRAFEQILPQVNLTLKGAGSALIFLDEPQPPWLPEAPKWSNLALYHFVALHLELSREGWIEAGSELVGYRARARVIKGQGQSLGRSAPLAVEFGKTLHSRETW